MNLDDLEKRIDILSAEIEEISFQLNEINNNLEFKNTLFQQAKEIENSINKFTELKITVPDELKKFKIDLLTKIINVEKMEKLNIKFLNLKNFFSFNHNLTVLEKSSSRQIKKKVLSEKIKSVVILNKEYKVQYWKEIVVILCEHLYELHKDNFNVIYQIRGIKNDYFSENKNRFIQPAFIKNANIYCETKFSAKNHLSLCKKILALFGYKEDQIKVRYY